MTSKTKAIIITAVFMLYVVAMCVEAFAFDSFYLLSAFAVFFCVFLFAMLSHMIYTLFNELLD